ncbi:hypothetical protein N431DRAFT_491010 [Stipitochalara longipes BDJ]|nr:hypothetical protein N431DRAFT_491010 [Stipitochalara longipes BDJ]
MSKFRGAGKWRSEGPSRTNTGSSIRGKISAPIPIPDDEFPIRSPGTGIAVPLGTDGVEARLRASIATELDNTALQTGIPIVSTVDPKLPIQSTAGQAQPFREIQIPRTNQPSSQRDSGTSVPSGSSMGKPQRKKSSFRSALGRLFGKRSKNGGTSPPEQGTSGMKAGQHRSDPTALNRIPTGGAGSQKRSASLPINEYNRALRSHSTATEEFPNTENETNLDSIHADGQRRPRRATTPSRLWTPTKGPNYGDWTGLSPRPASSHARGSRVNPDAEADTADGIGMAVTSGSQPKRRSRSLGEMREAAVVHTVTRRRSDEIRYWRESYDPGILSPLSSHKAEAEEPIIIDEPGDNRDEEPQEQPQPFNFGPLGEMAGMKITQAASLDTRVSRLEERMLKMERVLYSRQNRTSTDQDRSSSVPRPTTDNSDMSLPKHPNPKYQESPVQSRQQIQESRSQGSQKRSSSYGSSRPSTVSTRISNHPSFDNFSHPLIPSADPLLSSSHSTARPLSTSTTIRAIPSSSPTLPKDGNFTAEHYTTLMNMILVEQSARQQLEAVVHNLQQQLSILKSAAPTPGSAVSAVPPRAGSAAGREFSSFEQDDSSDDEGRYLQEDFQTPNEPGGHFGDEIFGDAQGEAKSAPRTLSLSQITLGKGAQQGANF